MKNKILVLYIFIVPSLLFNCDNEPYEGPFYIEDNSCVIATQATSSALDNYNVATQNNYSVLCQVYSDALENQIEICGDENGLLQAVIDSLGNCTDEISLCNDAIAATQFAQNSYNAATNENIDELCIAYKNALQYQIEVCGDDGALQAIVDELGNCETTYVETVGNWKLVAWVTDMMRDINNDGVPTNQYLEEIDCYDNETITFNADGTGTFFLRSTANITYAPEEGSATDIDFFVTCTNIIEDITFSWIQRANTLSITLSDGTVVNHFRNGNGLYVAYDDGFFATSVVEGGADISERITYVYYKL